MTTRQAIKAILKADPTGKKQFTIHAFGGIPGSGVEVDRISAGFDWDHGKVLAHPKRGLWRSRQDHLKPLETPRAKRHRLSTVVNP